jgi:putative sugar O-methyltransferase
MIKDFVKYCVRKILRCLPDNLRRLVFDEIRNDNYRNSLLQQEAERRIGLAISTSNLDDFDAAEAHLREAARLDPYNLQIVPHLGRIRFLKSRSLDRAAQEQNRAMLEVIGSMHRELESSDPIYVPSEFWETFGKFHMQLLERYGIENFKRTVSHNYQNWFMVSMEDPQVRQLLKTWPTHFSTQAWLNTIEVPDHVGLHTSLTFDEPSYPLAFAEKREIYRIAVGLLWEFVNDTDSFGVMEQLAELEVGNPVRIYRRGRLISSDIAHSVRERHMLLNSISCHGNEGLIVGELGAGHGRLAEVFGQTTNYRYYIFDITPALFVSQWYLKSIFPNERLFEFRHFDSFDEIRDELQQCRFAFFTANQIELIPDDHLQLFINMNSLTEMRIDQIRNFLGHIDRLTTRAFLSRQWIKWENIFDGHSVTKDIFALGKRWRLAVDKPDDIYPEFFNQVWVR